MVVYGLASSIDVEAATSLAADALRAHPSDENVQAYASRLDLLLKSQPTPLVDGASPERNALARVAELKGRRDVASLVRDMDAFPECEELQRDGCDAIGDTCMDRGSWDEAGAIGCIIRSLDLFPYTADTQRGSLRALGRLTLLEANARRAGSAGAVRLAVHALRSFPNEERVIINAFIVLVNVSGEEQFCVEALNLGALALGVAALRRYDLPLFLFFHVALLTLRRHTSSDTSSMRT